MKLSSIASSVVWIDFITIVLSKYFNLGRSLDKWYHQFGAVAVLSDCLVIILGILLVEIILPDASIFALCMGVVIAQIIHDLVLYQFVIRPLPVGTNAIIDLFKEYASENSWKILVADSTMMVSSVLLASQLDSVPITQVSFIGLLGVYALSYIIYTK